MNTKVFILVANELWQLLLLDIGGDLPSSNIFEKRSNCEGISFLTRTMPILLKSFLKGLRNGHFVSPSAFGCVSSKSKLPKFLYNFFKKVFKDDGTLRTNAAPSHVAILIQLLEFGYKINFDCSDRDHIVYDNFISCESDLQKLVIKDSPLLAKARMITADIFSKFRFRSLRCKYSNGVVSDIDQFSKWTYKGDTTPAGIAGEKFLYLNESHELYLREVGYKTDSLYKNGEKVPKARAILVPKDMRAKRLISCEPASNQFLQQGLMEFLVDTMESSPWTGGHVNFKDQSKNQELAIIASKDQSFSTLDLKEASDRVSLALVKEIFRDVPELLNALIVSRSPVTTLPTGDVFLRKFAPMGSAVCFPILAYCVWVLSVLSQKDIMLALQNTYVYGDDLICSTNESSQIIQTLEKHGLKVNVEKSFINSRFAESCGVYAFDGIDVTPFRIKKLLCEINEDPKRGPLKPRFCDSNAQTFVSLVESANEADSRGFTRVRDYIKSFVETKWECDLPFIEDLPLVGWRFKGVDIRSQRPEDFWSKRITRKIEPSDMDPSKGRWHIIREPNPSFNRKWIKTLRFIPQVHIDDRTDGFSHLRRSHSAIGSGEVIPFGQFDKPRKGKLVWCDVDPFDICDVDNVSDSLKALRNGNPFRFA